MLLYTYIKGLITKEDLAMTRIRLDEPSAVRSFESGATRDTDSNKLDFEGFLAPTVLLRYAQYMNKNRVLKDGSLRSSDNWQRGIPLEVYMKSLWRHFFDCWLYQRGGVGKESLEDALCGVMFNSMGYLYELLKLKSCPGNKSGDCGDCEDQDSCLISCTKR